MCLYLTPDNPEWIRDLHRGRSNDLSRFCRIHKFAYTRWERSRNLVHSAKWLKVMEAVKRRAPPQAGITDLTLH